MSTTEFRVGQGAEGAREVGERSRRKDLRARTQTALRCWRGEKGSAEESVCTKKVGQGTQGPGQMGWLEGLGRSCRASLFR